MRLKGYFVGMVTTDPEIVTIQGKKPFLSFTVTSPDSYSEYPNRVKIAIYSKDCKEAKSRIYKGALIRVEGEVAADAYIGKKSGKPTGALRLIARDWDVEIISPKSGSQTPPSSRSSSEEPGEPPEDNVPF